MPASKKKSKNTKKRIKKKKKGIFKPLLKLCAAFTGIILIALIVIAAVFEKQIAEMVIKTLNKQLKTELRVSDASLSLIWKFPQAAVYLHDARIKGVGGQEEMLLDVGSVSLQCSTLGLLTGNYNFTSISVNNGSLFIYKDIKGDVNYDIFKSDADTESKSSDLNMAISNANLSDVTIHYLDETSAYDIRIKAQSAFFEGDFIIDNELNLNKHTMTSYAELYSDHVTIGETTFLRGKDFAYDGSVILDLAKERYSFEQLKLYLGGNEFKVDGSVAKALNGTEFNLLFDSERALLGSVMQLIPDQFMSTLGQFESNGYLSFDARINGISSVRSAPVIEVNFGLKDGRVTHPDLAGSMKNVNFDVHFTNGNGIDDRTAKLDLLGFEAFINNEPINMTWEMTGLENPMINMSVDGKIPLNAVYAFLGEKVTDGSGWVEVAKLSLNGRLKDMTSMYRIPRVTLDGVIDFNQAYLLVNEIPVTFDAGSLALENNVFNVNEVSVKTENSDMLLNGVFQNVLPVLLSDSLNSQNATLSFQSSLNSTKMDIDELLAIGSGHTEEEIQAADEVDRDSLKKESYEQREYITSFLKGTFVTNIDEMTYGNVLASGFNGEVEFENSIMSLKRVKVNAMEGDFELNSKFHFEKEPKVEMFLDCKSIDIQQFLAQLNNFNQDVITDQNLRGKLEALIKINLFMDSLGNFKHEDLFVVADVKINNGELNHFKMLDGFAAFVKMRDLEQIAFTELKNQFKIENGRFYMPAMFIQSNALNLLIGGEYSFNHDMDFKIKVNAGQVIASKFKKYNPDKTPVKARKKGFFNLYRQIYGNLYGDYQILTKPVLCKKYLDAQLRQNLPMLTNTLRTEFSKTAGGTEPFVKEMIQPEGWEDIPEYQGGEGEDEFIEGF